MRSALPAVLLHAFVLFLVPPLLPGIIGRTKALCAGRTGPPVLQLYYDLFRLARKHVVISTTTSWVFWAAPAITLTAVVLAGLFVPLGRSDPASGFAGDFLVFAYLLALARFATTTAALDTGSSFEGMGAAREVTFGVFSEPALFLSFLVLARSSQSLSLGEMLKLRATGGSPSLLAALVLVSAALFIVTLAENSRIPVDDPATHLELTMIHEVMILDHSGPLLALALYASSIKLFLLGSVLLGVLGAPATGEPGLDWILFFVQLAGLAVAIGVVESTMARLRLDRVPHLLIAAMLGAGLGLLLLLFR